MRKCEHPKDCHDSSGYHICGGVKVDCPDMPNPVKDGATGGRDIGPWQGVCRRCGAITEASGDFQAVSRQTYNHKPARHHVTIRRLGNHTEPMSTCCSISGPCIVHTKPEQQERCAMALPGDDDECKHG